MSKVQSKQADYPQETEGSRLAEKLRSQCNDLSETDREDLFHKGMAIIYGKADKKAARAGH
jgi:hypothetical protein